MNAGANFYQLVYNGLVGFILLLAASWSIFLLSYQFYTDSDSQRLTSMINNVSNANAAKTSESDSHTMKTDLLEKPMKMLSQAPCGNVTYYNPPTTGAQFAIVITGGSRTFHECWPSTFRTWVEHNDVDVYMAIRVSEGHNSFDCWQFHAPLLQNKLRGLTVTQTTDEKILDFLQKEKHWAKSYPFPQVEGPNMPHINVLMQYYWNWKGLELLKKMKPAGHKYKLVVRLRPDLAFPDQERIMNLSHIYRRAQEMKLTNFVSIPDYNHWAGLNDQLALMDEETGTRYLSLVEYVEQYSGKDGVRFHQETLLKHHLLSAGNATYVGMETFYSGIQKDSKEHKETGAYEYPEGSKVRYCLDRGKFCGGLYQEADLQHQIPTEHSPSSSWPPP